MRVDFDLAKSRLLRSNPKRGIGFEEAQELFELPYYSDRRFDLPERFRAIGWAKGKLYSVIYEVCEDGEGEFYRFVTLWKATEERNYMLNTLEANTPLDAEQIAEIADAGESVSRFFTNAGSMVHPIRIQRVNVDFAVPMLQELDRAAQELNVSRQAIIKSLLRQSLDRHYLASAHRTGG